MRPSAGPRRDLGERACGAEERKGQAPWHLDERAAPGSGRLVPEGFSPIFRSSHHHSGFKSF